MFAVERQALAMIPQPQAASSTPPSWPLIGIVSDAEPGGRRRSRQRLAATGGWARAGSGPPGRERCEHVGEGPRFGYQTSIWGQSFGCRSREHMGHGAIMIFSPPLTHCGPCLKQFSVSTHLSSHECTASPVRSHHPSSHHSEFR